MVSKVLLVVICLVSFSVDTVTQPESRFECFVLGRAQDGGMPHLGCEKKCCVDARSLGTEEYPACLGIHDTKTGKLVLIEATPAIEKQVSLLHTLTGVTDRGRQPIDALLPTSPIATLPKSCHKENGSLLNNKWTVVPTHRA